MSTQQHLSDQARQLLVALADELARGAGVELHQLDGGAARMVCHDDGAQRAMAYAAHRLLKLVSELSGRSCWDLATEAMGVPPEPQPPTQSTQQGGYYIPLPVEDLLAQARAAGLISGSARQCRSGQSTSTPAGSEGSTPRQGAEEQSSDLAAQAPGEGSK